VSYAVHDVGSVPGLQVEERTTRGPSVCRTGSSFFLWSSASHHGPQWPLTSRRLAERSRGDTGLSGAVGDVHHRGRGRQIGHQLVNVIVGDVPEPGSQAGPGAILEAEEHAKPAPGDDVDQR